MGDPLIELCRHLAPQVADLLQPLAVTRRGRVAPDGAPCYTLPLCWIPKIGFVHSAAYMAEHGIPNPLRWVVNDAEDSEDV